MSDNPLSILAYNVWDVMIDACHWHAGMQTSGQQLVFRMIQCLLATNYLERKTYYDICERDYDTGTGYKNKLPLIAGDSLRFQIRHIISMLVCDQQNHFPTFGISQIMLWNLRSRDTSGLC
ncbi:hypothetical protein AgCh_012561 [Apium graveolens]